VRENCKQSCSVIEIYHQPEDYQRKLMETYPDYSSEEYLDGWGWQEDQLVPVPGFGFFPSQMKEELEEEAQAFLREGLNITGVQNLSVADIDMYKCTMVTVAWRHFFPWLQDLPPQEVCEPLWDGASCVPATSVGEHAIFPCMTMYDHKFYDTAYNASRECLLNESGSTKWEDLTNYTDCRELCPDPENSSSFIPCDLIPPSIWNEERDEPATTEISIHIYFVGYSVSLLALLVALCIFLSFRELRCLRHKIHMGLFLTFLLADLSWIFTALIQSMISPDDYREVVVDTWCASQVVLRYFHLTTFFWMFLEGLYLFLQVQLPLSLATVKHLHFLVIGWGCPLTMMTIWVLLRLFKGEDKLDLLAKLGFGQFESDLGHFESELGNSTEHNQNRKRLAERVLRCPFIEESAADIYAYKLPVFILLVINTFFLVWIMVIVLSKLRSRTALDHDRRHYKAAKALVIIIPLLGFTYMLTLMGPRTGSFAYTIFQAGRAALLSTQGFVISLPYCFLNTEVQGVLRSHWERWKLVRNVNYSQTPRTSIYYAPGGGSSENKVSLMTTRVDDAGLLMVPGEGRPMSLSKQSSRSVSFSEIVPPVQVVHTCQENGEVQEGGGEVQPPSYAQSQRQPATRPIEMYHLQP